MLNLQVPFLYRFEDQDKGPIHINVNDIREISNYDKNSNWCKIKTEATEYISFLSPEELVADIINSYNLTMKAYR